MTWLGCYQDVLRLVGSPADTLGGDVIRAAAAIHDCLLTLPPTHAPQTYDPCRTTAHHGPHSLTAPTLPGYYCTTYPTTLYHDSHCHNLPRVLSTMLNTTTTAFHGWLHTPPTVTCIITSYVTDLRYFCSADHAHAYDPTIPHGHMQILLAAAADYQWSELLHCSICVIPAGELTGGSRTI